MTWSLPAREVRFPRRTLVMGIVNVNDDSFSGDGTLDPTEALALAARHVAAGADIIDVGAESARTNRGPIPVEEEVRRLRGFLAGWPAALSNVRPVDEAALWPPVLAVNTWRPEVVAAVLDPGSGVELINDMGGLPDDRNARLCAAAGASLLVMHTAGPPKVAQLEQRWADVMASLDGFFTAKLELAAAAGLAADRIILDPGIDFAKQRDDNLTILRELGRLQRFGRPVLVPVSRKTVIGEVLGIAEPAARDAGTVACIAAAVRRGAHIVRVHNAAAAWQAAKVLDALAGPIQLESDDENRGLRGLR